MANGPAPGLRKWSPMAGAGRNARGRITHPRTSSAAFLTATTGTGRAADPGDGMDGAEVVAHISEALLWYATTCPRAVEVSTMDLKVRPDRHPRS